MHEGTLDVVVHAIAVVPLVEVPLAAWRADLNLRPKKSPLIYVRLTCDFRTHFELVLQLQILRSLHCRIGRSPPPRRRRPTVPYSNYPPLSLLQALSQQLQMGHLRQYILCHPVCVERLSIIIRCTPVPLAHFT